MSTDPQVSAPQWTTPDAKSAVTIPRTAKTNQREQHVVLPASISFSFHIRDVSNQFLSVERTCGFRLTDAEDDLVDVDGGEVQKKEREVDDKKQEAQNDAHPLLETFPWTKTHNDNTSVDGGAKQGGLQERLQQQELKRFNVHIMTSARGRIME